jgi:hypothetical protein
LSGAPTLSGFLLSLRNFKELSPRSLILLVAYHMLRGGQTNFTRTELTVAFRDGGVPLPKRLGTRLLRLTGGKAAPLLRVTGGKLALSLFGQKEVQEYLETTPTSASQPPPLPALTALVGRISGDAEQRFLAEAIACLTVKANRAAVVMVWLMTLDHLQRYVLARKLNEFNAAWAARADCNGRRIAIQDDFLEIRDESSFIEILRSATIVTKDVRKILDEKLGFRNTCAHPNDIVIPDSKVLATIEDLVYNVILKYAL